MKKLSDFTYSLLTKRRAYFLKVRQGRDRHALSLPCFSSPNHAFLDEVYNLKANLVFWVMANNLKLKYKEFFFVFNIFLSDTRLDSVSFVKLIKKRFAIKTITKVLRPLVKYSGAMRLELNHKLNRKDGCVKLYLKQTQIAEDFFRRQMRERIQREKNFFKESFGRKLVEQIREEFQGLVEKYSVILHTQVNNETERVFLVNRKRRTLQKAEVRIQMIMTGIFNYRDH